LQQDLEGMVAKRKESTYEQGLRTGSWLKVKNLKSCDCVIFGYLKGIGARESTFGALVVGLFDKKGKPIYITHIGTGFSQQLLECLIADFKKLKTTSAPFVSRDMEGVTWIEPKLVCEVICRVVTRDCRLRIPRFQVLRIDKEPRECTIDQIEGQGICFLKKTKNLRRRELKNETMMASSD
jgi:bifunctional non-homologous end joining protein LigD